MTFTELTKPEFTHQEGPLFFDSSSIESMLFDFAMDANGSTDPLEWGKKDFVFPAKSFGEAHCVLMSDKYMKRYRSKGTIEFRAKEEDVDIITLSAPLFGHQQTLYFYD